MPQVPPYNPPKKRSTWGWIVALISIGLFAAMFLGFLLIGRQIRERVRTRVDPPQVSTPNTGETAFGEQGASFSGRETIITKSFPLTAASRFSINNPNGEITIEGWDQPQAEVRVIKRGGSRSDRRNTEVYYAVEGDSLKIRTSPTRGRGVEVAYEIKLPRTLKLVTIESASGSASLADLKSAVSVSTASGDVQLSDIIGDVTLNSASGDVSLSEVTGKIKANAASGSIALTGITGSVQANTASGDIKAVFEGVTAGEPLEFSTANGDVEIEFKTDINADLDIETIKGDIEIDEKFQITPEKQIVGQRASGRIGAGGQRLKINTVNGDVKVISE
jgi:hypothetical protein